MRKIVLATAATLALVSGAAAAHAQPYGRDFHGDRQAGRDFHDGARGYGYGGRTYAPFHAAPYAHPHGYGYRPLARGGYLPRPYFAAPYYVDNWSAYHVHAPGRGYRWVRYGNDIVLANLASGLIAETVGGVYY